MNNMNEVLENLFKSITFITSKGVKSNHNHPAVIRLTLANSDHYLLKPPLDKVSRQQEISVSQPRKELKLIIAVGAAHQPRHLQFTLSDWVNRHCNLYKYIMSIVHKLYELAFNMNIYKCELDFGGKPNRTLAFPGP